MSKYWLMVLAASLLLCGCESGDSATSRGPGVTGSWTLTIVWDGDPGTKTGPLTLQQSGSTLTGSMRLDISQEGDISGTASDTSIDFTISGSHGTGAPYDQFTGTINGDAMSGTCSSSWLFIANGTWTATR